MMILGSPCTGKLKAGCLMNHCDPRAWTDNQLIVGLSPGTAMVPVQATGGVS